MQTVIENITPAKAREYYNSSLAEEKKHRPVSMDYIKSYADTMRQGTETHQGRASTTEIILTHKKFIQWNS